MLRLELHPPVAPLAPTGRLGLWAVRSPRRREEGLRGGAMDAAAGFFIMRALTPAPRRPREAPRGAWRGARGFARTSLALPSVDALFYLPFASGFSEKLKGLRGGSLACARSSRAVGSLVSPRFGNGNVVDFLTVLMTLSFSYSLELAFIPTLSSRFLTFL